MNDRKKTKAQLIAEVENLRQRVSNLEHGDTQLTHGDENTGSDNQHLRSLINIASGALFCYEFDDPIPVSLPLKEQVRLMRNCTLTDCNTACANSYGYEKPEDVIGKKFKDLFKGAPKSLDKLFTQTIKNGYKIKRGEGITKQPDGSLRYFLNNAFGVLENGHLIQIWGSFIEITERKKTEEALLESEEKYRSIFEGANDAILHIDKNLFVLDINPAFTDITGITEEEMVGKSAFDLAKKFVNLKQLPRILKILKNLLSGELQKPYTIEFNGKILEISTSRQKNGNFAGIIRDITERLEAEKRITESEENYRSLFEHIPDGVYRTTLDGRFLAVNPAFKNILGFDPNIEVKDLTATDFYADSNDRDNFIKQVTAKDVINNLEIRMKRLDGQYVDCLENARTIRDDKGNILYFEGTLTDITERKQAKQVLELYTSQLETLNTISAALSSSLELDKVLELILDQIRKVLPLDSGAIFLQKGDGFQIFVDRGINPSVKGQVFPSGNELFNEIRNTREPIILENVQDDPRFQNWSQEGKINSWMGVPLISRDTLIGFLTLDSFQPTAYTQEHARLSKPFAAQAAQAIENARLFGTAQRRLERLTSLRDIDHAITSSLDLRVTMNILLGHIVQRLEVDAAAILLHRQSQKILEYVAGQGFRTKAIQATSVRLGQGSAGVAALERRRIQIADIQQLNTGILRSPEFQMEKFVSYIGIPLIAKGIVVGVLEIYHRTMLNPDSEWLEFLETLARQAAIAIDNISLFTNLQRSNAELIQAYDATIEGWAQALELRDMEAVGHSRQVVDLAVKLARTMGIKGAELMNLRRGALLHDIGKMGVPDTILQKSGKLSEEEWQVMVKHPVYAYEWLSSIQYLRPALDIPYSHHEKWDGTGYPRGLREDQIPIAARIFAIVDVWEALISDRPYKEAWSKEQAKKYIRGQAGIHFDPRVVDAFMEII